MKRQYKCPRCGCTDIGQDRKKSKGPMWCKKCKFRISFKERSDNPFIVRVGKLKGKADFKL